MSPEMRAVLHIVNSSEELKRKVLPHIEVGRERIYWEKVFREDFGGGHRSAVLWIKAIWCDELPSEGDPFDRAFVMDSTLQTAVIKGLLIRWGLIKN